MSRTRKSGAGRKPKPTAIKILEGNPGKRKLNAAEPKPEAKAPKCPTWLSPAAKREWKRIAVELETLGLLTCLDRTALAAYCQAFGRWEEAEKSLKEHGPIVKSPNGFPIQNPYLAVANKAMQQMHSLLTEFGMTPSSRTRVQGQPNNEPKDDFEDFLQSKIA